MKALRDPSFGDTHSVFYMITGQSVDDGRSTPNGFPASVASLAGSFRRRPKSFVNVITPM